MSSGSEIRRRPSSNGRRHRLPPHPSSPLSHRRTPPTTPRKSEQIDILHKCSSEPLLRGTTSGAGESGPISHSSTWLHRPMTCTDVFSPSLLSPDRLRCSDKVYPDDYKVVVSVTVEGSTGPVRTMVKLGSSVDETIKLVLDQYRKEGRNPPLGKDAASQYDLHLSQFSFESLGRSNAIGSIGSRSFYLRKCTSIDKARASAPETSSSESTTSCPVIAYVPASISQMIALVLKKMHKLWKILGCLHDS